VVKYAYRYYIARSASVKFGVHEKRERLQGTEGQVITITK